MKFEFMTANRIIFERGGIKQLGKLVKPMGDKVLLSSGMSEESTETVMDLLNDEGLDVTVFYVFGEPSIEGISEGLELARSKQCNIVVGFGGGSAMDTAKAIAAMLSNSGDVLDYLEVIGKGKALQIPSIPCVAIPTTSGTGAEVTKNAVLSSKENKVKVSLRSPYMLPQLVLLDPELTISVPKQVTASTGLDALTQVLEPYVSNAANPITDAFCREGLTRAARSLKKAYDEGNNVEAREDMAITSLLGGLALANAKLGAVHGFAGVIGGMFPIPHGVVCAALLPYAIETNVKALLLRQPDSEGLKRFDEVAHILTGSTLSKAEDGVKWIQELCHHLQIPRLSTFGLSKEDFKIIIENSMKASSMKGNPIELTYEELEFILDKAL